MTTTKTDWTDELVVKFINEYKDHKCLWDVSDLEYRYSSKKVLAWSDISTNLGISTDELKRKMYSLMASYRRERRKELKNPKRKTVWFAYEHLDYLSEIYQPKLINPKVM